MSQLETDPAGGDPGRPRALTPTHALPHPLRVERERLWVQTLTVILIGALATLAFAAGTELDNWAEWVVLGGIVTTTIGVMIAIRPR